MGMTPVLVLGQTLNPLSIPLALDTDTFQLVVTEQQHQFHPGGTTATFGVNWPYLGPTLIMHRDDISWFRVTNRLPQEHTVARHAHSGEVDGVPPRDILPGEHWDLRAPDP